MWNQRINLIAVASMSNGIRLHREQPQAEDGSDRASGLCVCPDCGLEYYVHPRDGREPWMTIVCSGRRYKL
jgi:hypothetical protein